MHNSNLPLRPPVADLFIASLQNSRIKHAIKLRDRRYRDHHKETLVEGYREILRALENKHTPICVYYCPALFLGANEPALLDQARKMGAKVIETDQRVFEKISYRDRPDGLLAIAPIIKRELNHLVLKRPTPLILVAETVEKPGNLGAMLRSADGAGADAIIVCDRQTDINNPNVIRASVGTIFSVPVVEADVSATQKYLRRHGLAIIAATPSAERIYWDIDLRQPLAFAVGSEQYGLSDSWMKSADIMVRIPMQGKADSLNVAAAATMLLYEALRQRSQ